MAKELKSLLELQEHVDLVDARIADIGEIFKPDYDPAVFADKASPKAVLYKLDQPDGTSIESLPVEFTQLVAELIESSRNLTEKVHNTIVFENISWSQEKEKADFMAAQDRKHAWLVWRDRSARWVLGALFAVLLYSGFVELADAVSWLHIPVRDLIISK